MTKRFTSDLGRLALYGYICIITASSGYHSYYRTSDDGFFWHWLIIALIGVVTLGMKNYKHYEQTKDKRVFLDVIVILFAFCFPCIPLARGLATLGMMVICGVFSMYLINAMFHPWR